MRLLDNAIRYTKQGSITLSVDSYGYTDHAHQDMLNIVFTIADTGIGIQEERLDNIFDLYESGDSMKTVPIRDMALDLQLRRGYADILDAELSVESVYGAGSTLFCH